MVYHYCNQCGKEKQISQRVYEYSLKHFGRALCRECQDELRSGNESTLKDLGKLTVKFGEATKKVHDTGGFPLTLLFLGGLLLIIGIALPTIFSSAVPWWILAIVYILSFSLIGVGVLLYMKEKK